MRKSNKFKQIIEDEVNSNQHKSFFFFFFQNDIRSGFFFFFLINNEWDCSDHWREYLILDEFQSCQIIQPHALSTMITAQI